MDKRIIPDLSSTLRTGINCLLERGKGNIKVGEIVGTNLQRISGLKGKGIKKGRGNKLLRLVALEGCRKRRNLFLEAIVSQHKKKSRLKRGTRDR